MTLSFLGLMVVVIVGIRDGDGGGGQSWRWWWRSKMVMVVVVVVVVAPRRKELGVLKLVLKNRGKDLGKYFNFGKE